MSHTTSPTRAGLLDLRNAVMAFARACTVRGDVGVAAPIECYNALLNALADSDRAFAAPSPGDALRQQIEALQPPANHGRSPNWPVFVQGYELAIQDVVALLSRGEADQ